MEHVACLNVSVEGQRDIADLPQHTPGWHLARRGNMATNQPPRLTASKFGAAAGHESASEHHKLLVNMVWPECDVVSPFARKYMQYGTDHEDVGRRVYLADRQRSGNAHYTDTRCRVYETGLVVSLEHGWLGASPDGVVEELAGSRVQSTATNRHHMCAPYTIEHVEGFAAYLSEVVLHADTVWGEGEIIEKGGLEIKCPAAGAKVLYSTQKEHAEHAFPWKYFDQVQGAMAVNNWAWNDTVVYTPHRTEVIRFHRDTAYWEGTLLPALKTFYFKEFLPLWERRRAGKLAKGSIVPMMVPLRGFKSRGEADAKSEEEAATQAQPKKHKRAIDDPLQWFAGTTFKLKKRA
jgi:hypothetical protein